MPDSFKENNMRKVAIILSVIGTFLLLMHSFLLQGQQTHGDENWLISIESQHRIARPNTIISIHPPYESKNIRLVGRNLNHPGFRVISPQASHLSNKRAIRLRADKAGKFHSTVEFTLQQSQLPRFHKTNSKPMTAERRQLFLQDNEWLQLDDSSLMTVLNEVGVDKVDHDGLAERIFQKVYRLSGRAAKSLRTAPAILASRSASRYERAQLMVALSRKAGIPARIITGLEMKDDPSASFQYWVELYINDRWLSYHPALGYSQQLPVNYVALDKYDEGMISARVNGAMTDKKEYTQSSDISIERIPASIISPDNLRSEWYQVLMLDRLPSDTRAQLGLLMLLPLGALLSSFIRQFMGLHSYGVFTPTILALAVTYTEQETTMLILAITLTLVYFGRPAFHHEMSRTPRLSIIFTLVATSMVIGVSVLDYFSLATDGHLILLPIVIITSLVDRFFAAVEKFGSHTAFIRLVWTLILTLITLPVLQQDWLGALLLRYPEAHLFTLSLLIMVATVPFGKYKVPQWLGFLTEPEKKSNKKDKEENDD
ncbi:MAG: transglutaminase-like domain-containing protein [Gammaproteobacteria bacterium]|nr:transglutaminase-like domain-containing protein [Gammaproteobacteria bacterium]